MQVTILLEVIFFCLYVVFISVGKLLTLESWPEDVSHVAILAPASHMHLQSYGQATGKSPSALKACTDWSKAGHRDIDNLPARQHFCIGNACQDQ